MNSPALHLPPPHLTIPAPGWTAPVQTDLFGLSLLESLGLHPDQEGYYIRVPSAPNSSGFFLEDLHPVRIQPLPQPAWCTVFLCYRDPNPEDFESKVEWFSGVAGGLAFGPRPDDRLFYFQGTPHIHAPSASLDAAVRHALDEARGMFAHYHGAGDGATAMAAQALAELLRRA